MFKKLLSAADAADAAAERFINDGWAKHPLVVAEPHPPILFRPDDVRSVWQEVSHSINRTIH